MRGKCDIMRHTISQDRTSVVGHVFRELQKPESRAPASSVNHLHETIFALCFAGFVWLEDFYCRSSLFFSVLFCFVSCFSP